MSSTLRRLIEAFQIKAKSGYATPQAATVYETPAIPLSEVIKLYERDPTCKASVDLLAASAVGSGFYTTVTGCKFQTTTVECSIEDVVKTNVEILSQDLTPSAAKISGATYADYAGAVPFYESHIKKDSTTLERVTDWKFTIDNNLKQVPVIRNPNGNILKYLPNRQRDLTGEVVFEFESKEEFDDIINDTEFTLEFGLGGTNKAAFSNCKWENTSAPTRIEELVSLKAAFVAKSITIS